MIRDFLVWLATTVGKGPGEFDMSWSEALASSLNFWGLLEGTHVMSLMLFAGTIFIVDFRLLGISFRKTPVSVISDRVLPLTVFGFGLVIATGLALFYAKPLLYYHNLWFRLKLIFLAVALVNILIFHFVVQRDRAGWDANPIPPLKVRAGAAMSILAWLSVISMGRLIAYDFVNCGKPLPHWINVAQECARSQDGALDLESLKTGAVEAGAQASGETAQ